MLILKNDTSCLSSAEKFITHSCTVLLVQLYFPSKSLLASNDIFAVFGKLEFYITSCHLITYIYGNYDFKILYGRVVIV